MCYRLRKIHLFWLASKSGVTPYCDVAYRCVVYLQSDVLLTCSVVREHVLITLIGHSDVNATTNKYWARMESHVKVSYLVSSDNCVVVL